MGTGDALQLGVSDQRASLLDGSIFSSLLLLNPGARLSARVCDVAGARLDEGHAGAVDPFLLRLFDWQGLNIRLKVVGSLFPGTLFAGSSRSDWLICRKLAGNWGKSRWSVVMVSEACHAQRLVGRLRRHGKDGRGRELGTEVRHF